MANDKCKYCKAKVPKGCIRCYKCDDAWQDGHKAGYKDHKSRVMETVSTLLKLCGVTK